MKLKFKRMNKNAQLPVYATKQSSGMDLHACWPGEIIIESGEVASIPTGLAVELPDGYEAQIRGRSGLAFKKAIFSFNGTIDSDYRGEIKVLLINHSKVPFVIEPGDRIGQMVVNAAIVRTRPEFVDEIDDTERGEGGFGSTGTSLQDDASKVKIEFVQQQFSKEAPDQDEIKNALFNHSKGNR